MHTFQRSCFWRAEKGMYVLSFKGITETQVHALTLASFSPIYFAPAFKLEIFSSEY